MNILSNYWIYINNMNISHYGFVCPVSFSNEKYIRVRRKRNIRKKLDNQKYFSYSWIVRKYFPSDKYYSYSYSQVLEFTNYSYSYLYRSWLRKSIPIPIRRKIYYLLITELHNKGGGGDSVKGSGFLTLTVWEIEQKWWASLHV